MIRRWPMPESEPTNSATIAPITASVTASLMPAKMLGSACGNLNRRNVVIVPAPMELAK